MEGQDVEDDERLGCPWTSKTDENVKMTTLSIRIVPEMVNIDTENLFRH